MKIGYACINLSVDCTSSGGFILKNYSTTRLKEMVRSNLGCLEEILQYNLEKNILFFRISSGLVPFASHFVNKFNWQDHFKKDFERIGKFIKENNMRVSMHPGQYTVLSSPDSKIVNKAIDEILYHVQILDLMKLDKTAKVQIHVGGVYDDKPEAIKRFIKNYKKLPKKIKDRLVIENDERSYSASDCLEINKKIGVPVVLDILHYKLKNNKEDVFDLMKKVAKTWKKDDGVPIIDYSTQKRKARKGTHSQTIGLVGFKQFLKKVKGQEIDIMLEVKDKNISAEKIMKMKIMPKFKI